jgi:hypothetical protein
MGHLEDDIFTDAATAAARTFQSSNHFRLPTIILLCTFLAILVYPAIITNKALDECKPLNNDVLTRVLILDIGLIVVLLVGICLVLVLEIVRFFRDLYSDILTEALGDNNLPSEVEIPQNEDERGFARKTGVRCILYAAAIFSPVFPLVMCAKNFELSIGGDPRLASPNYSDVKVALVTGNITYSFVSLACSIVCLTVTLELVSETWRKLRAYLVDKIQQDAW